jgi:predicted transcriptional regulator
MNNNPSLLSRLRSVSPHRATSFDEALRVAELQACKLLDAVADDGTTLVNWEQRLSTQRLSVVYEDLPVSGTSHWNGERWIIALNRQESRVRQRFTLLHEYKHIVDHGHVSQLYTGDRRHAPAEQAEVAADYFAGCALVPKRQLKAAWGHRVQQPAALAEHFGVSVAAIEVRLSQTGLNRPVDREPVVRCARPIKTSPLHRQRFQAAQPRRYA